MAAADNNVRPWRQEPAATSRRARRSGLARLLLQLLELLQLDRKPLLLLAASLMPACIIPVGPDWQDPPGEANLAPQISNWMPFIGTKYAPVGVAKFTISVSDPNAGDTLFFKWIANYTDPIQRRILNALPSLPPPDNGQPFPPRVESFDCNDLNNLPTENDILVVVADREFVDGADPITVSAGGLRAFAAWRLIYPCSIQSP